MTNFRKRHYKIYIIIALCIILVGMISTFYHIFHTNLVLTIIKYKFVILKLYIIICLATLVNLFLRWMRWHFLSREMNIRIPIKRSIKIYFSTIVMILTPLAIGEIIRAAFLNKEDKERWKKTGKIWLFERSVDGLVLLSFVAYALYSFEQIIYFIILGSFLCFYILNSYKEINYKKTSHKILILLKAVLVSFLAWILPASMFFIIFSNFEYQIDLSLSLRIFSESSLVGGLSFLPSGVVVTGSKMLDILSNHSSDLNVNLVAVALFRAGTSWFAILLSVIIFIISRKSLTDKRGNQQYFDAIASEYDSQIAEYVQDILVEKKINYMVDELNGTDLRPGSVGFDFGCGNGSYANEMIKRGYDIYVYDRSANQIGELVKNFPEMKNKVVNFNNDIFDLDDNSLDFIYAINVFHHIIDKKERDEIWKELVRIVRPEGIIMIHEINNKNPIFNIYMNYIFPLIKDIDEGTEEWLDSCDLQQIDGAEWSKDVRYFTFLPDFLPQFIHKIFAPIERRLEKSKFNYWGAHFFAILVKNKDNVEINGGDDGKK